MAPRSTLILYSSFRSPALVPRELLSASDGEDRSLRRHRRARRAAIGRAAGPACGRGSGAGRPGSLPQVRGGGEAAAPRGDVRKQPVHINSRSALHVWREGGIGRDEKG